MSDIPSTEQIQREEAADFVVRREVLRRTLEPSSRDSTAGLPTRIISRVAAKYIVTAFLFSSRLAGLEAFAIRLQLARPR